MTRLEIEPVLPANTRGRYRPCESCDFTTVKLLKLHKIGKILKKNWENWNFHIVSINAPEY